MSDLSKIQPCERYSSGIEKNWTVFKKLGRRQQERLLKEKVEKVVNMINIEYFTPQSKKASCSSNIVENTSTLDSEFHENFSFGSTSDRSMPDQSRQNSLKNSSTDVHFSSFDSSNSSYDSLENVKLSSADFLKSWYLKNNITHSALNELLVWLKSEPLNLQNLPKDARTLLQTSRVSDVETMGTGEFYYFGIKHNIIKIIEFLPHNFTCCELDFNIDGLPIQKSNNMSFWPILCKVVVDKYNFTSFPFPIAIYCGKKKPPLEDYFKKFVEELSDLTNNGLLLHELNIIKVKIRAISCDLPAKSFILNTKGHNGYYACGKCKSKGDYVNKRVVYTEIEADLRTDEDFAKLQYPDHQKGPTPLIHLDIGLVSQLPIDYMHNVCLGVMKKLLLLWRDGSRLFRININKSDEYIEKMVKFWPVDFNRKPRSIRELEHWKAIEYRQFLLYAGPVILKDILPLKHYCNFLVLNNSLFILLNKSLNLVHNHYANELLNFFVRESIKLYGQEFCVTNVHSLVHLAEDAKHYGSLEEISCFCFENYMSSLKRMLHKTTFPLQQVVNRLKEGKIIQNRKINTEVCIVGKQISNGNDLSSKLNFAGEFFGKFLFRDTVLSTKRGNNCVLFEDGTLNLICHIGKKNEQIFIFHEKITIIKSFFTYPTDSSLFNVYTVELKNTGSLCLSNVTNIKNKCLLLPLNSSEMFYCAPLLHTIHDN